MNLSPTADDKVEALVGLVLQAVDQRLTTVREQLAELTNAVARRNADVQDQIAECRELISSATAGSGSSATAVWGAIDGDVAAADAGGAQLLHAANLLTERVTFLESRVNQYTDERVAELRKALEQMLVATPAPLAVVNPPATVSPAIAQDGATAATPSWPAAAASAPVDTPTATEPARPEPPSADEAATAVAPAAPEFDLDEFSARLNARLSALVERAIGT